MWSIFVRTIPAALCLLGACTSGDVIWRTARTSSGLSQQGTSRLEDVDRVLAAIASVAPHRSLSLIWGETVTLPLSGAKVDFATARATDGSVQKFAFRPDGVPTSWVDAQQTERAARNAAYGKLSRAAYERIALSSPSDILTLHVWFAATLDRYLPDVGGSVVDVEAALAERLRLRQVASAPIVRAVVDRISALGGKIVVSGMPTLPMVVATIASANVPALQQATEVAYVDVEAPVGKVQLYTELYDADDSEFYEVFTKENSTPPSQRFRGTGIKVGLFEAGDCGAWSSALYLPSAFANYWGLVQESTPAAHGCALKSDGQRCDDPPSPPMALACSNDKGYCQNQVCVKNHLSAMASDIGSVKGTESRNASEVFLHVANSPSLVGKLNWLYSHGVQIYSDSEGKNASHFETFDFMARWNFASHLKSAGNNEPGEEVVNCPMNSVCVGSYAIRDPSNPIHVDTWKLDYLNIWGVYQMSGKSSYWDNVGLAFDAEKPDLVGMGGGNPTGLHLFPSGSSQGTWSSATGSSGATAMTAGQVAVLQGYFPTSAMRPDFVRAALMTAAASHNIHGVGLSANGGVDEQDGAGAPKAHSLKWIVDETQYALLSLTPSDFSGGGKHIRTVPVAPGQTLRAVVSWMYCAGYGYNQLTADFDLYIRNANSYVTLASSASYSNNIEMVEYTNSTQQTVWTQIRLTQWGTWGQCLGAQHEYAAVTWLRHRSGAPE